MGDAHYGLDTQTDCQLLANYLSMFKSRLNEISFFLQWDFQIVIFIKWQSLNVSWVDIEESVTGAGIVTVIIWIQKEHYCN